MKQTSSADIRRQPPLFETDEVLFNLLYRILERDDARVLTDGAAVLLAQTAPDMPAWIWTAPDVPAGSIEALREAIRAHGVAQVTARPDVAMRVFDRPKVTARLIANECPLLCPPEGIEGRADGFSQTEEAQVASMFAAFDREAKGGGDAPETYLPHVRRMRERQNFRVWRDADGVIVAMAAIAHRAPRHARINSVFTLPQARGKGYAGAVVAVLCDMAQAKGLTPMLYTDGDYAASNRAYQKVGFVPVGILWTAKEA